MSTTDVNDTVPESSEEGYIIDHKVFICILLCIFPNIQMYLSKMNYLM